MFEAPDEDREFCEAWRALSTAERLALPDDIAAECVARYRRLNPYDSVHRTYEQPKRGNGAAGPPHEPHINKNADQDPDRQPAGWPDPLDLERLAENEPDPPRFIIPDWLPSGYATLLAGHGGAGKSQLALHLAVCLAAGCPWWGMELSPRRILYLSCEDRESVLHWRLRRICAHLQINLSDLRGWLSILDLVGNETILWERDPRTGNTLTMPSEYLKERMRGEGPDSAPQVLIVDGISDTFGGNENAKTDVKRFVNSLVAMVPADTGAVVLVGHVSKPGSTAGAAGDGYSGTTGWHNSVRARWYLYPETEDSDSGDRPAKTGDLVLELQKTNYGKMDGSMRFHWDDHVGMFVGEIEQQSHFDRKTQDDTERTALLAALVGCAAAGIAVPAAMQGPRTTYLVLSNRPEFPETLKGGARHKMSRFRRQIEVLVQSRQIREIEYTHSGRHPTRRFEVC